MDTQKRWIELLLAGSSDSAMHFANDSFDVLKHLCYILNFGRMLKDVHFIMGTISGGRDTDRRDTKYKSSKAKTSAVIR